MTELWFEELKKKQDACYHKVKSRYKKWPSAYASGALVRCRKVGAKNWGNSAEIISKEKKNRDYTVGSQEEGVAVKKVGFLVNLVKMIRKELNLVEDKMLLRELNKDVGHELERYIKSRRRESPLWYS